MPTKKLSDNTPYTKAVYYNDEVLTGDWSIFIKLDGVRALRLQDGTVVSRNSKPLHNLNHLNFNDAEIFSKDWETSVSLVRSQSYQKITQDMVYNLDPVDARLFLGVERAPTAEMLYAKMEEMLSIGHEGLIIRKGKKWLKVVPKLYADVRVIGYKEGTGKNKGMLGSVLTKYGSIGSGFTDAQRVKLWNIKEKLNGKILQAGYREITKGGKLRFPSFEHWRLDKDEESLPWLEEA